MPQREPAKVLPTGLAHIHGDVGGAARLLTHSVGSPTHTKAGWLHQTTSPTHKQTCLPGSPQKPNNTKNTSPLPTETNSTTPRRARLERSYGKPLPRVVSTPCAPDRPPSMTANSQAEQCLPFSALGSCSTLRGQDSDRVGFGWLGATRDVGSPEEPISFADQTRCWEPLTREEQHGCTQGESKRSTGRSSAMCIALTH